MQLEVDNTNSLFSTGGNDSLDDIIV